MYHVLYYLKGEGGCQIIKGFSSRRNAYDWVASMGDKIDWYKIEPTE